MEQPNTANQPESPIKPKPSLAQNKFFIVSVVIALLLGASIIFRDPLFSTLPGDDMGIISLFFGLIQWFLFLISIVLVIISLAINPKQK